MSIRSPYAIVLNGASSAGKSTLASTLQQRLDDPWFHHGVDDFLKLLPLDERQQQVEDELSHVLRGIHAAMGALAAAGNRVIIDHVLAIPGTAAELRRSLDPTPSLWVGLYCPVEVLEEREDGRSREQGTARRQIELVHRDVSYDLEFDTSTMSCDECATRIKLFVDGDPAKGT